METLINVHGKTVCVFKNGGFPGNDVKVSKITFGILTWGIFFIFHVDIIFRV